MRLMLISLTLGSVAAVPATSYLQNSYLDLTKLESGWFAAQDNAQPRYVTAPVKADEIVKTVMATGTMWRKRKGSEFWPMRCLSVFTWSTST